MGAAAALETFLSGLLSRLPASLSRAPDPQATAPHNTEHSSNGTSLAAPGLSSSTMSRPYRFGQRR